MTKGISDARDALDDFIKQLISAVQITPQTEHAFEVVAEHIEESTRTILPSKEETDSVKATSDRVITAQIEATISTMGREPLLASIDPAIVETVTGTAAQILNDNEERQALHYSLV